MAKITSEISTNVAGPDVDSFWTEVLTNSGPMVVLVLWLVWSATKREQEKDKSTADVDRFIRETLIQMQIESTTAIRESVEVSKRIAAIIEKQNEKSSSD